MYLGDYMIFGVIIVMFIYILLNYYIGIHIYKYLALLLKHINPYMFWGIFGFFVVTSICSFIKVKSDTINFIGGFYLGLFVYLLLLFFIKDLFRIKYDIPVVSIILCISFTICIYGLINSTNIRLVSYNIKDSEIKGKYKIALISDLHLGSSLSESNINKVIDKINDSNVDLVLIVGDLFNDNYNAINNPQKIVEKLKSIKTKYGIYMCLGNHDSGKTYDKMLNFINDSNIKLLNDEYDIINDDFVLLGRVDNAPIGGFNGLSRKDTTDVLSKINSNLPIIVMDHNPLNIKEYDQSVNLLLMGHSHKGQIFPANIVTDNMYVVDYGIHKSNKYPTTIVSSGAGTWMMPLRIGSNSEVVIININ